MEKYHLHSLVIFLQISLKHFSHGQIGSYRIISVDGGQFKDLCSQKLLSAVAIGYLDQVNLATPDLLG